MRLAADVIEFWSALGLGTANTRTGPAGALRPVLSRAWVGVRPAVVTEHAPKRIPRATDTQRR
jgi:hypothetical protein